MLPRQSLRIFARLLGQKQRLCYMSTNPKPPGPNSNSEPIDPYFTSTSDVPQPSKPQTPDDEDEDKANPQDSNSKLYAFALGGCLLGMLYFLQKMNTMRDKSVKSRYEVKQKAYGKADIGGPWHLVDKNGSKLSSKDLEGSYYVVYFGFCKCPDICPQSLQKLTKAFDQIKKMKEGAYFDLKLVFVSVDPDRDSPETIQKFLSYFSPGIMGITGLTNDDPKLKDMMKKFKIYATKIEFETEDDKGVKEENYTLDHTVISYLVSDDNEYLIHLGSSLSAKDLAEKIVDHVVNYQSAKVYK